MPNCILQLSIVGLLYNEPGGWSIFPRRSSVTLCLWRIRIRSLHDLRHVDSIEGYRLSKEAELFIGLGTPRLGCECSSDEAFIDYRGCEIMRG